MSEHKPTSPARKPILITFGSNMEPETNLPHALRLLGERVCVTGVSKVYESAAVGADGNVDPDQPVFLNAVAEVETDLEPLALKYDVLRAIEAEMGRKRGENKFAPRVIDLDIALYGDLLLQLDTEEMHLIVPDPDIVERAHIALPLADLAPDVVHPTAGQTLAAIAEAFNDYRTIRVRPDLRLD